MPEPLESRKADGSDMSIADRFKSQWFVSIFLLCSAVAAATWAVEYEVVVSPLNSKIDDLRREVEAKNSQTEATATISQIVLKPTYLSVGHSITTDDGSCLIHVDNIYYLFRPVAANLRVALSVTVGAAKTQFKDVESGRRLTVSTHGAVYYVDINEIQEPLAQEPLKVSVEVTRQPIFKPTQK